MFLGYQVNYNTETGDFLVQNRKKASQLKHIQKNRYSIKQNIFSIIKT